MQDLLEAVKRCAAAVSMRIATLKTNVMSELIHGKLHHAILLGGESLERATKFEYPSSMFIASGQGTVPIRSRINITRSAFPRLQSCL